MKTISKLENYKGTEPVVLSIGNFDGLHRGHQYLLKFNQKVAQQQKALSLVLSFDPHPMKILKPELFLPLCEMEDQKQILAQLGIDAWLIEPFNQDLLLETAPSFYQRLIQNLNLKAIVVGPDFCFGRNREGNVQLLKKWGESQQVDVIWPSELHQNGVRISSSEIRRFLKEGQIEEANEFLGRPFSIFGPVLRGDQRGRLLGFPTANIFSVPAKNLKPGVYSTIVYLEGQCWRGATNVGYHPTFENKVGLKVETHIINFDPHQSDNLYDRILRVEFKKFIRPEMKFDGIEALTDQIKKDVKIVSDSKE